MDEKYCKPENRSVIPFKLIDIAQFKGT